MDLKQKTIAVIIVIALITSMSGCLGGSGQAKNMNHTGNTTYYPDGYYDSYGFWHSYYHNHWYDRYFYDDYYGSSYPRSYSSVAYVSPSTKSYKTVTAENNNIIRTTSDKSGKTTYVKSTTTTTTPTTQTQKVDLKKTSTSSLKSPSKPVSRTYKSSFSSSRRK
ncbi:MAG: hypothetical protein PHN69_04435 [Candidatus Pacebacteria bacterium]|nr:hypothetical protein [Fermentimonas sp.]MDD4804401.1 hypothetical protein [Candidatus Paceibacterota bacterium]